MLQTTMENLGKPMSTVFIETRREAVRRGDNIEYRDVKTEEIISTATIQGVFKSRFQISGLNPGEAHDRRRGLCHRTLQQQHHQRHAQSQAHPGPLTETQLENQVP